MFVCQYPESVTGALRTEIKGRQSKKDYRHQKEEKMFLELLKKRRSIRRFQKKAVEKEKIDILLEAALRSPSSRSLNPWEFVAVTDRSRLRELAESKPHGGSFIQNAPLAVIVCGDPAKSDVWVEDCSIAALILHLQAADLGLGSCWVQIRKRNRDEGQTAEDHVKKILGLDSQLAVEAIIAIGYPGEEKKEHAYDSLAFDKVRYYE
jgi:nitroreductase